MCVYEEKGRVHTTIEDIVAAVFIVVDDDEDNSNGLTRD
jgi:hypothetical protein